MDDNEYYSMMRRQYSNVIQIAKKHQKKSTPEHGPAEGTKTPGSFSEWTKKYGHEDAEMFYERNKEEE